MRKKINGFLLFCEKAIPKIFQQRKIP